MAYYLIPHFEKLAPRDFYLLGFLFDSLSVSDGLVFWRFVDQKLPLLSYLPPKQQASHVSDLALQVPALAPTLRAYASLIEAGILKHVWIAAKTWLIPIKRTDTPLEASLITEFNDGFRHQRTKIAAQIQSVLASNPQLQSADAIRIARAAVAENLIKQLLAKAALAPLVETAVASKLRRRFAEHLKEYLKSERVADTWSQKHLKGKSTYAGYLADVQKDLSNNAAEVPIFASPEVLNFFSKARQVVQSSGGRGPTTEALAARLGYATLASLPDVGFKGIEEVLKFREKLAPERESYSLRMLKIANDSSALGKLDDRRINEIVKTELLPAVREFNIATENAKNQFQKWLVPVAAVSAGFFAVGASHVDNNTLVGLALTAVTSTLTAAGSLAGALSAKKSVQKNPSYAGLSLVMKLQEPKK